MRKKKEKGNEVNNICIFHTIIFYSEECVDFREFCKLSFESFYQVDRSILLVC